MAECHLCGVSGGLTVSVGVVGREVGVGRRLSVDLALRVPSVLPEALDPAEGTDAYLFS